MIWFYVAWIHGAAMCCAFLTTKDDPVGLRELFKPNPLPYAIKFAITFLAYLVSCLVWPVYIIWAIVRIMR